MFLFKRKLILAAVVLFLSGQILFSPFNTSNSALAKVRTGGKNTVSPSAENFDLGMRRYKEHDLDGAVDAFLQAIYFARNVYNPEAYYWLGVSYQEKNLDAKAIEALKKNVEQSIKPIPETHLHLAQLYLRNNRLDEADEEAVKALVDYHGPGPQAHNIMGQIAEKRDNFKHAEDEYIEALGDPPWRYTEAWMNYAEVLMKEKEWGRAIEQLRKMLNHTKALKGMDHQRIYLDIGICLLAKGDHQGAMDNWHEVLNYNPNNAAAHLQLGLLLDSERHISAAIKEYKEYLRLSPINPETDKIKKQVLILEQRLRAGSPDNSSQSYSSRPALAPYNKKSAELDELNEQNNQDNIEGTKHSDRKKDALEPANGKESGF